VQFQTWPDHQKQLDLIGFDDEGFERLLDQLSLVSLHKITVAGSEQITDYSLDHLRSFLMTSPFTPPKFDFSGLSQTNSFSGKLAALQSRYPTITSSP